MDKHEDFISNNVDRAIRMRIKYVVPDNECTTIFQQWTIFFKQFQQTDQEFLVMSMASIGI